MIIPVKCFTCGKVLGDKYLYYVKEVRKQKIGEGKRSRQCCLCNKRKRCENY